MPPCHCKVESGRCEEQEQQTMEGFLIVACMADQQVTDTECRAYDMVQGDPGVYSIRVPSYMHQCFDSKMLCWKQGSFHQSIKENGELQELTSRRIANKTTRHYMRLRYGH